MLIQVNFNEQVKALLEQDKVMNLNIIGALDYLEEPKIYVDHTEHPTGVVVIVNQMHYLYTQNMKFVDQVLEQFCKSGNFICSGLERSIGEYIEGKDNHKVIWTNPCDIYYYPHQQVDTSDICHKVSTVPLEEAPMIDSFYTFQCEESLEEMRENLRRRPSSGIYVDGELVCWVMVHEDDSMGIMYTKEEHRRKGYAVDVTLDLMDKLLKMGKTPYVQILESNGMSPGLAKKCGFIPYGKCTWFEIEVLG